MTHSSPSDQAEPAPETADTTQAAAGDRCRACLRYWQGWHRTYHASLQTTLQPHLEGLTALEDKLDRGLIQIAAFGLVSRGKSAVLNALFGEALFPTGCLNGVTQWPRSVRWTPGDGRAANKVQFELIDTPGLDEVNGQRQAETARTIARQSDLILFVITGALTTTEYQALSELQAAQKPVILVLNKIDQISENPEQVIQSVLSNPHLQALLSAAEIVMTAAEPAPTQLRVEWPDGRITHEWQPSPPLIEPLQRRLLTLLNQEGRTLLSLNVLFQVQEIEQAIAQTVIEQQEPQAQKLIVKYGGVKALAIVLSPFIGLDLVCSLVADLGIIPALAQLYGLPITRHGVPRLWQKVLWSLGSLFLAEVGSHWLFGLQVFSEGFGGINSYLGGAVTQAGIAAYGTVIISQAAQRYLQAGCTWSPQGPSLLIQEILNHLEPGTILHRLRRQLTSKIVPIPSATKPESAVPSSEGESQPIKTA